MTQPCWSPHVTVATVIYQDGRYLMVEEHTDTGIAFNQPAGHWEQGETLIAAAERETLEETGYSVTIDGLLGLSQLDTTNNGVYLRITFIASNPIKQPNAKLDDGIIAAHWLTYEEVVAHQQQLRSPLVLHDIERHRRGLAMPLDLLFHAELV